MEGEQHAKDQWVKPRLVSLRGRIFRNGAATTSCELPRSRIECRTKRQGEVERVWRRWQSKFLRVSQSDLYPGLAGNVKVVKPSELPIMSARDISRHRHSLTQFTGF